MNVSIFSRFKSLLLSSVIVLLLASAAAPVHAQVNPRGTTQSGVDGRVLQVNTDACPAQSQRVVNEAEGLKSYYYLRGGLTVSVSPQKVASGEFLTFTYGLSAECQQKYPTQSGSYTASLYHTSFNLNSPDTQKFQSINNKPASNTVSIQASGNQFSPGSHGVVLVLQSTYVESGSTNAFSTNYFVAPVAVFEVTEGTQTGDASLKAQSINSGNNPLNTKVFYEYSFAYTAGASGKNAAFVTIDCGGGELVDGNFSALSGPIAYGSGVNARCVFPKDPKQYTIKFQALDVNRAVISGAQATAEVNVTGTETNTPTAQKEAAQCGILDGPLCIINYVIATVVFVFNSVIKHVLLNFLGPFIETLVSIRTYKDDFAQVIYSAWQILRNLGNIFFILSIVAIGVATVFRISGYAVKDLLVKLIVGAILINFSLTIAQAVLGIADTATNQFLGPNTGAIKAIVNPLVSTDVWANVTNRGGDLSASIQGIVSFWLSFAAFIAFLGVAFLLFFRIIILWVLLMLSPLPYVAMVLPVTKSMSKKWWSKFIQWAFNAPIVAFMLNLTATITTANQDILQKISTVQTNSGAATGLMFAVAGQAIPIAFMFMTVKAGAAVGKGAAGFVDKAIAKGAKAAFVPAALTGAAALGLAKGVGGAVGGATLGGTKALGKFANYKKQQFGLKLAESGTTGGKIAAAALSPIAAGRAIKSSFAARAADKKKTAEYTQDAIASSLSTSPLKNLFGHKSLIDKPEQRRVKEEKERMEQISYSEKANTNATVEAIKKGEGKEALARIKLAVQEGDFGEILKKSDLTTDLEGKVKLIDKLVQDKIITEDTATRLSAEIDGAAKKKGDLHYVGGTRVDQDKLVRITAADITAPGAGNAELAEQKKNYAKKLKDLGAGGRARETNFGMIVTEDPTVAGPHTLAYKPEQIVQIANMSDADYNAADSVNDKRKRQEREFLFDPTNGEGRRNKAVDDLSAVLIADARDKEGIALDATTARTQAQEKFNKYLRKYLQTTTSGQDINKKAKDLFTTMSRENANFGASIKGIQSADRRQLQDYVDNLGTSPEEYSYDLRSDIADVIDDPRDPAKLTTAKNELRDTVAKAVSERFVPKSYGITSAVNDTQVKAIRDAIAEAVKTVTTIHSGLSLKDTTTVQPSLLADIDARLTALGAASGLSTAEIHSIADKASKI